MEPISSSQFFNVFKSCHKKLYQKAVLNSMILCIPVSSSYCPQDTKEIIQYDSYVMRPSAYESGIFVTHNSKTLQIDGDKNVIRTLKGFADNRTVGILGEESCYTDDGCKISLIWLDNLLEGQSMVPQERNLIKELFQEPRRTASEYEALLKTFPENSKPLALCIRQIRNFNKSYAMVKHELEDAKMKIDKIWEALEQNILSCNVAVSDVVVASRPCMIVLTSACESFVYSKLYDRLMAGLVELYSEEDSILSSSMQMCKTLSFSDMGVESHSCDLSEAVKCLERFSAGTTPSELIIHLQSCFHSITQAVGVNGKEAMVTTDDLIPLLSMTLSQSAIRYPYCMLMFLLHFCTLDCCHEASFLQTTFNAAIEYIFSVTKTVNPATIQSEKKISLPTQTSPTTPSVFQASDTCSSSDGSSSPPIHVSSASPSSASLSPMPQPRPTQKKAPEIISCMDDGQPLPRLLSR